MQQTNVLEYLEHTVKRLPDKVAYSNESEGLTFAEVYHDSRAIGSYLNSKGYYGEPVVVFMKKHPKAIAAFYGCVYGGNYYVPIDEEMPRFRIDLIFDNLRPKVMICDESTQEMAKTFDFDGELLIYDEVSQSPINEDALAQIRDKQLDTDPIYIVFTSGSTGVPKGVVACHRSVIDYIENLSEVLEFNEDTRFANQTPLYFDACLKELYPTLKFGASTVIVPKSLFMFPVKLVEFLNEHKVNTVCWVVSALTMISSFKTFDKVVPEYLHTVAFGSEVFPIKQFKIWKETLPNAKFTNLYGPTETTGMCCYYKVNRDFELGEVMPVGRPFHNTEIILLNDENKRAAQGEVGEICVRGTSLTIACADADSGRTSRSVLCIHHCQSRKGLDHLPYRHILHPAFHPEPMSSALGCEAQVEVVHDTASGPSSVPFLRRQVCPVRFGRRQDSEAFPYRQDA